MIAKIVGLEGGPAGGKSTAMQYTGNVAKEAGVNVFTVPEVASEMLASVDYQVISQDPTRHLAFQTELLWQIVSRIEQAKKTASKIGQASIILADRVDIAAYITAAEANEIYKRLGYSRAPMHSLVDTIIYFPSLAHHDPAHYERVARQNPARYETAAEARATCNKNLAAVKDHPNFWKLSQTNYQRKLRYAANIALHGFVKENNTKLYSQEH